MKKAALIALSALMTVGISAAAFAGSWQVDNRGWWYLNDNGTWPVNTWQTINGKNYYFDTDGYMAESQYIGGTLVNITGEALPAAYGSIIREYIDCSLSQDPDTYRENHVLNYELTTATAWKSCSSARMRIMTRIPAGTRSTRVIPWRMGRRCSFWTDGPGTATASAREII